MTRGTQNRPMPMPIKNDEVGAAPSSITPTPGAVEQTVPGLDRPATLIPGQDPSPAGLGENPHVHDPNAIKTELDQGILNDFEAKSGLTAQAPISRKTLDSDLEDEELDVPTHLAPPDLESADNKSHSNTTTPKAPKNGLEVVAKQKGFYNQCRLRENESFFIKSWDDRGDWMRFTDPDLEKEHQADIKSRKARKI